MALITCKDCKKEFSTDAKKCPHCGANPPKSKIGCLPIGLVVVFGLFILGSIGSSNDKPPAPATPCHNDWQQCLDNSDLVNNYQGTSLIQSKCKTAAEDSAKYGEPKFPFMSFGRFHNGNDYIKTGKLVLVENDAQFQNGFGAMVHSIVTCLYDLRSDTVLDVDVTSK